MAFRPLRLVLPLLALPGALAVAVDSAWYSPVKKAEPARLPLLPYPAHVERDAAARPLRLALDFHVQVHGISPQSLAAVQLHEQLGSWRGSGERRPLVRKAPNDAELQSRELDEVRTVELVLRPHPGANLESYELVVVPGRVELSAPGSAGLFYAVQTFKQLASMEGGEARLPQVTIKDTPRFEWRGLHLDVSRHFFSADEVKSLLDVMAMYKMNRFHWHLTDDQGWRLPVEGLPKLVELGAEGVGGRHAYTEQEIKQVVAYARSRHIEVVPEVDVPGHAAAAIAAYPELGNSDIPGWKPPEHPFTTWGVHEFTLAPTKGTLSFLGKVFGSVSKLFPGTWVHIGGDEARADEWADSPRAEEKLVALHENSAAGLQRFFNSEVAQMLRSEHKEVIVWDETQHIGGLPQDGVVIMAWRSANEAVLAAQSGRRVINADQAVYYFDHYQGPQEQEPYAICCYASLQQVYDYDPMPKGLTPEQQQLVIGGQGQLWSEYFPTWNHTEYMAFPRSLALAERLWSSRDQLSGFEEFRQRLAKRLPDLDARGVRYRPLDA